MSWIWLIVGILVGLINWFSLRITVTQFSPQRIPSARRSAALSAVLRWMLSTAVLASALQGDLGDGLSAFAGLMSARWIGIISLRLIPISDEKA